MHAQNFVIDDGADRKAVEAISKSLPESNAVSPLTLVIKSIYSVDRGTLMVTAKQKEVFMVLHFVCQKKADSFEALLSSVNIIT